MRRDKWLSLGFGLLMVVGAAGTANAAPITFSEFPVGTAIDNEYAGLGVLFAAYSYRLPVISNDFAMPGSPILRPDGGPSTFAGDFFMVFPQPITDLSFQSGYWDVLGSAVIALFDPSFTLLGVFSNTVIGPENMSFSGLGLIQYVYFSSTDDPLGGDIDNLEFTVPEPGSLLLLAAGLGLAAFNRRFGRNR